MGTSIDKVLIANRGEIARRVIRSCRNAGIQTVAVYSDADKEALYVKEADEAVALGAPEPAASYLNIPKLIEAAQKTHAQAIHPGYGFLSENAAFAQACEQAKLIFIGPSAQTIESMGDKIAAKKCMEEHGVPTVPSKLEPVNSKNVDQVAQKIGLPVLLKAAAGGGGKGMRVVREASELQSALEAAGREAQSAFGDDRVFVEKFLEQPRHIEIQILADSHGNTIHLFERDCSVQRRHQKIIEETPSPIISPEKRHEMGQAAVKAAQACNYINAGTVEFLFDQEENFYFLEMNTRLQVEHPVTEWVTGMDLVRWQLRIAAGESLWQQMRPQSPRGHSIEMRIYAEDPANQFLPSIGRIEALQEPTGPGIRVDSALYAGWEVPVYYDPLLSKLIVWGETRQAAIRQGIEALSDYRIDGVTTNIEFLKEVLTHPDFVHGNVDTHWVEREFENWAPAELNLHKEDLFSPWIPREQGAALKRRNAYKKEHTSAREEDLSGPIQLKAPMPGKVIKIDVKAGDAVEAGKTLIVLEAMKMEHSLASPRDGKVEKVHYNEQDQVTMGEVLIEIT